MSEDITADESPAESTGSVDLTQVAEVLAHSADIVLSLQKLGVERGMPLTTGSCSSCGAGSCLVAAS
jgi:hypothetical protein